MDELFDRLGQPAMQMIFDALVKDENRWKLASRFDLTLSDLAFLDKNFRALCARLGVRADARLRRSA